MLTNEEAADVDEGELFMLAVGGPSHGRVRGFGCVLDPKLPRTTRRGRATIIASDLSGVTNLRNKWVFTDDVLVRMLNELDMRLAEEKQERKRDEARTTCSSTNYSALLDIKTQLYRLERLPKS